MARKYFGLFDSCDDINKAFNYYRGEDKVFVEPSEVLLAVYGVPPYEGYAFVLFERDGILYEVNASHCSCYGLEGQWDPEVTTPEALSMRRWDGSYKDWPSSFTTRITNWIEKNLEEGN